MDQLSTNVFSVPEIEVIPPEHEEGDLGNAMICLCCQKKRSASWMDADGCGICDECLAP
ncbi:hypothetical protein D3C87_1935800 [compost metagenome]|jgi:hypothetical protein|nr:hypothetical protein BLJAPNOD_05341 [Ensifer sp. M14]